MKIAILTFCLVSFFINPVFANDNNPFPGTSDYASYLSFNTSMIFKSNDYKYKNIFLNKLAMSGKLSKWVLNILSKQDESIIGEFIDFDQRIKYYYELIQIKNRTDLSLDSNVGFYMFLSKEGLIE